MRKFIFLFAVVALVMQSCSTGNMFTKKRYGHLKWIDHNTTLAENKNETSQETKAVSEKNTSVSSSEVNTTNDAAVVALTPKEQNAVSAEKSSSKTNTTTKASKPLVKMLDKVNPMHAAEKIKNTKPARKIASAVSDAKEGSTGELLLMAVLIACAIILFLVLDSALGGILGLILIIFVLLVLLRYFGVI